MAFAEDRVPIRAPKSDDPELLLGVAASPGIAIGQVVQVREERFDFDEQAASAPC